MEDMGLDFNALDLPINLKLWHDAGLRFILSDPETVKAARARKASASEHAPAPSRAPRPAPTRAPAQVQPRTQTPTQARKQAPVQTKSGTPGPLHPSTQANWSPELREYFSRVRVPAFSLWTYWDFPMDLSPSPDRARQALLKNMLKALHWPQGSSVFWPVSRIVDGELVPDPDLFAYGVQAIAPVYVFCFGKKACSLLLPGQEITTCKRFSSPLTSAPVQVLPGLEEMLPDNKGPKSLAWKILKSYTPMPM